MVQRHNRRRRRRRRRPPQPRPRRHRQPKPYVRPRNEIFTRRTERYPLPQQLERLRRQQSVLKHSPRVAYHAYSVVRQS